MKLLVILSLLLTGCDVIVKSVTYDPKCVNGYYVHAGGFENQGHWGLQNLFCEEIKTEYSVLVGTRCMKVGDDPRIKWDIISTNVIYAPTKCFNTMAGVKDVQQ